MTMGKIFAVGTHSTNDPTRAAFPFITAIGAIGAGKEAAIGLIGDAVYILKEEIAAGIHPVGFPALADLIKEVKGKATVYV